MLSNITIENQGDVLIRIYINSIITKLTGQYFSSFIPFSNFFAASLDLFRNFGVSFCTFVLLNSLLSNFSCVR